MSKQGETYPMRSHCIHMHYKTKITLGLAWHLKKMAYQLWNNSLALLSHQKPEILTPLYAPSFTHKTNPKPGDVFKMGNMSLYLHILITEPRNCHGVTKVSHSK